MEVWRKMRGIGRMRRMMSEVGKEGGNEGGFGY